MSTPRSCSGASSRARQRRCSPATRRIKATFPGGAWRHSRRWFAFTVRFLYGLRTAGPIAMGLAGVPWLEFLIFNGLGTATWAMVYCGLGYAFGRTIAVVISEIAHYEALFVGLIFAAGLAGGLWYRFRRRMRHGPAALKS